MDDGRIITITDDIVKLINLIGEAGINEINSIDMPDIIDGAYNVKIKAMSGQGDNYCYFDYDLNIKSKDNREMNISIEALDPENTDNHGYGTNIQTLFSIPNNKKFGFKTTINGWDYNKLINLSKKEYVENLKLEVDEKSNIINNIPHYYMNLLFSTNELNSIINRLNMVLDTLIEKKKIDTENIQNIVNKLSNNEINILKKVLKNK